MTQEENVCFRDEEDEDDRVRCQGEMIGYDEPDKSCVVGPCKDRVCTIFQHFTSRTRFLAIRTDELVEPISHLNHWAIELSGES